MGRWRCAGRAELLAGVPGHYGETLRLKPDAFVVVSGPEYKDGQGASWSSTLAASRAASSRAKLAAYRRYAEIGQE